MPFQVHQGHPSSAARAARCAYPLEYIPNAKLPALGGHPTNVILLTCDGYGVLPPVYKLSHEQMRRAPIRVCASQPL